MAKTETRVKVVFTKAGEAYSATQAYRLHDYIVLDGVTIYACKKVDPATMTCVGHPLTDTAYWDKFMDIADFKTAAEKATASANAAAKSATDAASAANTAKTNADKATEAANTAASAANTAKTNADTATNKANTAAAGAEKVNATITADNVLKVTDRTGAEKTLELMGQAEAATIKTELAGKFDKDSIVQELGEAEDKVISQKVVKSYINTVMSKTDFMLAVSSGFFRTNLCNQNDPDFKDGYFIASLGGLQANESVVVTGFIFFTKEMGSLVCSVNGKLNTWNNIYIALYDINKKFISVKPANKNVVWQEGVAFARFSLQKSSTGLSHYQVEVGTEPTPYIEYGKADIKDIVKVTEKNIATGSVTSEKIATGSVTSEKIATGLIRKQIQINTSDSEIEILLKMKKAFDEGYYDVYWEHGTYTFSSVYQYMIDTLKWSWTMGLPIGNNCRYYFNGSTLISNDPSDEYSESRNILDCKASSQNYELHDGILINNGGTYCVHDEGNGAEGFYKHVYDNMQIKYVKGSKTQYLAKCIGGGMGLNGLVLINRCIFDNSNDDIHTQDISWHKPLHTEEKLFFKIVITNSYFSKRGISIDSTFNDGDTAILEFINNSVNGEDIWPSNITLYKFNNEIRK